MSYKKVTLDQNIVFGSSCPNSVLLFSLYSQFYDFLKYIIYFNARLKVTPHAETWSYSKFYDFMNLGCGPMSLPEPVGRWLQGKLYQFIG